MNLNDPRLELIQRSQTDNFSIEEFRQLERSLREDKGFRELYVHYMNLELALVDATSAAPDSVVYPINPITNLLRRLFRSASIEPTPQQVPTTEPQRWVRLPYALAASLAGLLALIVPLPKMALAPCERLFRLASTEVAFAALQFTGIPVSREGFVFQMPGLVVEMAEQCSGARETLALLLAGLVLAKGFLNRSRHRTILILSVIPTVVIVKGLWAFAIASLAIRWTRDIIDSWIHHHGQTLCLAISMSVLLGLLKYLRRRSSLGT